MAIGPLDWVRWQLRSGRRRWQRPRPPHTTSCRWTRIGVAKRVTLGVGLQ